jgi:hypothetical protein
VAGCQLKPSVWLIDCFLLFVNLPIKQFVIQVSGNSKKSLSNDLGSGEARNEPPFPGIRQLRPMPSHVLTLSSRAYFIIWGQATEQRQIMHVIVCRMEALLQLNRPWARFAFSRVGFRDFLRGDKSGRKFAGSVTFLTNSSMMSTPDGTRHIE